MDEKTIKAFASLLEKAGFDGAIELIKNDLIPVARSKHIPLMTAAWKYANPGEEQDTSWHQLFHALQEIPERKLKKLDIHKPL
jgi:hypothetical protein